MLEPLESSPRGLTLLPTTVAAPPKAARKRAMGRPTGVPAHPGDPACWSWVRFSWQRGQDQAKQMRLLRGWHDGRCGICEMDADLVIDHDHGSGWVRGLLCDGCNKQEGSSRELDDVFARWRGCPPAAMLGLRVVYESGHRGIALPMTEKRTGPLSVPEWTPPHRSWPPEPWISFEPGDDDPTNSMTRAELAIEVKRLRRQLNAVREILG
jgi:hypothetical protein